MKKIILTAIVVTGLSGATLARAQSGGTFTNGLIAYFPFHGNGNDVSGNGYNINTTGYIFVTDQRGVASNAIYFNYGTPLQIPNSKGWVESAFTVSVWVKPDFSNYTNIGGNNACITGVRGDPGPGYGCWCINGDNNGSGYSIQQSSVDYNSPRLGGKWTHVCGVYNGSWSLYINGVLQSQGSDISATGYNNYVYIGGDGWNDGNPVDNAQRTWIGGISSYRYYGRALSSNEVASLFAIEGTPLAPISYTTNGSTLTLNSYTLGGIAVIPSSTNGLPVTSIGDRAFENNTNLTSVIIPAGVTNIGNSAFAGCSGVTNLTLPSTIITIGTNAFSGCTALTNLMIPAGATSIGDDAFSGCTGLTNLVIPAGVTSIGQNVFSGCSNLATITLPNSLVSIGQNAFSDCPNLTTVKASSDLLRYLDENQSALGVSQQAVSGFTPPVPGAYLPNLITNLLSSGSFLSGVAGSSSFLTSFTSQILTGSNNYGLATKTDVAALASQMSVLSNTLSMSIANQATGLSNALSVNIANQTALSNTLMASEASLASNPSFVASLATNPAFLNALAAQIVASPNNLGLAVKLPQTLTFSPIAAITYSSKKVATVALKATSSVNLTNTTYIVSNPSVGIINNANLIILGKGTATITATNSGNGIYAPASATQTLIVK